MVATDGRRAADTFGERCTAGSGSSVGDGYIGLFGCVGDRDTPFTARLGKWFGSSWQGKLAKQGLLLVACQSGDRENVGLYCQNNAAG